MNFLRVIYFLFCFTSFFAYSQVENIPAESEVYSFLSRMFIQGHLTQFDDIILPLSKGKIIDALTMLNEKRHQLSPTDIKILNRTAGKLGIDLQKEKVNFFDDFPDDFLENIASDNEKHLYSYQDSIINFSVDPLLESKLIYSNRDKLGSFIFKFGGRIKGSYDGWFGYYVEGTNGLVNGNRSVALTDRRVAQSFTFNDTKINYFDNTIGYLRLEKGLTSLQLGRERILWGAGQINKLILSDNPPIFDFIRFNFSYRVLQYDFIHGWLAMKPEFFSYGADISKEKRSKYIAISRLGVQPNEDISLGISQMIIYSNRPFEIAYLNPFLFWESAQRSLNDLDNSFLVFDGRFRILNGFSVNASAMFDDINFGRLFTGEWSGHNNGFAWQSGFTLASPLFLENTVLRIEYLQLRPYIFSHWGYKESLTYTNNSYLLGIDLNPNSTLLSVKLDHNLTDRVRLNFKFDYSFHGNNEYDSTGIKIRNVGGNVFEPYTLKDATFAKLLDGILEIDYKIGMGFSWEFFNNIIYQFDWDYRKNSLFSNKSRNTFITSLKLEFD